jgi:hypothetical protein
MSTRTDPHPSSLRRTNGSDRERLVVKRGGAQEININKLEGKY